MQITRSSIQTQKGPADWFTGDVYIDAVASPAGTSTFAAAAVHFTPGARTAWHTHPHGQTIFVTEGVGLCQREGGEVEVIRPGDRVFFEPGENHWHGATPDRFMVHIAMQQNDESGSPVTWGEHVTDEQYEKEPKMILEETYTLANGAEIPKLGLGTWFIDNAKAASAVKEAVKLGYRHIDTAQAYGNEEGVGEGVRTSGLGRDEIFVTSKLAAEVKSYESAVDAIDGSLKTMGLDHLDLMIIHSPQPWGEFRGEDRYFEGNREAWRALEEAHAAGKLRAIGVSNFEREDLDNLFEACTVKPMVNQILVHIANTPHDLISYSQQQDILVEAYSPIAHGELLKNEQVRAIADTYDVSVPQLSIRYTLQLGLLPLPKTENPAHMKSNADVDFAISDEDLETLKSIDPLDDYGEAHKFPVFGGTRA